MRRPRHRHRRSGRRAFGRPLLIGVLAICILGAGGAVAFITLGDSSSGQASSHPRTRRARYLSVPAWSLVAAIRAPTPGFASPTSTTPASTVASTWAGAPAHVPVLSVKGDRIEVRLPSRVPASQTAWIPTSSTSLFRTPYRIILDLSQARLLLFHRGILEMCAPAAVGTQQTPTPTGSFYVAMRAKPPNQGYGPFMVVTSAVTDSVTDWEASGAPVITISSPRSAAAIGRSGARTTNGAVHVVGSDLERLRFVPAGTPIDVDASARLAPTAHNEHACRAHRTARS